MRTLGLFGVRRDKGVRIVDVYAQRIVAWHAATTKHDRPGDDPAADGAVAARPRGASHRAGRADPPLGCRVSIHVAAAHRAPRARGDPALDRHRRRRLRQRPDGVASTASTRPSASAPPSSTTGPTRPSPTSSTPPPAGSTGTTTEGSTRPWATSRPSSTSKPTTLPSTESRTPYRNGREPGALQTEGRTYYRRKLAAGKTKLEALRCLKRRISDAIYRQMLADAERAQPITGADPDGTGPGGHCGATQESSAVDLPPHIDTSDQPLPGPAKPTLQPPQPARKTSRPTTPQTTG